MNKAKIIKALTSGFSYLNIHVDELSDSYVIATNGHVVIKMTKFEHNAIIKPLTEAADGLYCYKSECSTAVPCNPSIANTYNGLVASALNDCFFVPKPVLSHKNGKVTEVGLYCIEKDFAVLLNADYLNAFPSDCCLLASSSTAPVLVVDEKAENVLGLIMPIKETQSNISFDNAIRAYYKY